MAENKNSVVIAVEGMMCPHCEASVKGAMEELDFVASAVADHNSDTVTLELSGEFDEAAVKAAVDAKGYAYKGVK